MRYLIVGYGIITKMKNFMFFRRNNYHWSIPLLVGLIMVVINILVDFDFGSIVLIVTFSAILWYSFETRKLRIATQKQLEPILFLCLDQSGKHLELSNVGKTPISNLFIHPVLIGKYKFEFNILKPIFHIISGEKYKVIITKSFNLTRALVQSVDDIFTAMKEVDIKKIELILEYDTSFQINEVTKFIFEIPGRLPNEKDPARECKIYSLPK